MAWMALTEIGLKVLLSKLKTYRVSEGDMLYVLAFPNVGKYISWKYRCPPNRSDQFRYYQVVSHSEGVGNWSLKKARDKWGCIRAWSK